MFFASMHTDVHIWPGTRKPSSLSQVTVKIKINVLSQRQKLNVWTQQTHLVSTICRQRTIGSPDLKLISGVRLGSYGAVGSNL